MTDETNETNNTKKKQKITETKKRKKYNTNLLKQDRFVASTIFLYSEYVLRHIHFVYNDNLSLIDDSLKKIEPCIFDIFIILSFIDYINECNEEEFVMHNSIKNFMESMLHSKLENLKNNKKIMKIYSLECINEKNIYEFYKNYTDEDQDRYIRNLAILSAAYGVFANRVFTFRNKDYTKIKFDHKNILSNTETIFPKISYIYKNIFQDYVKINSSANLSFSIDTNSKDYKFNDTINFITKMLLLYNITEINNHEHPSLLLNKESLLSIIGSYIALQPEEFRNKIVGLLLWDKIEKKY